MVKQVSFQSQFEFQFAGQVSQSIKLFWCCIRHHHHHESCFEAPAASSDKIVEPDMQLEVCIFSACVANESTELAKSVADTSSWTGEFMRFWDAAQLRRVSLPTHCEHRSINELQLNLKLSSIMISIRAVQLDRFDQPTTSWNDCNHRNDSSREQQLLRAGKDLSALATRTALE